MAGILFSVESLATPVSMDPSLIPSCSPTFSPDPPSAFLRAHLGASLLIGAKH